MTKKFLLTGLIVISSISFAACGANATASDGTGDGDSVTPIEVTAEQNEIESVEAFGVVSAKKDVSISVDFNAKVEKIFVQSGEKIKKGDALVAFDISGITDEINSKQRELDQLKQKLNQKNYDVEKLNLQLNLEKKALENLKSDYETKKQLKESGGVSADELNKAKDMITEKEISIKSSELSILSTKETLANEKSSLNNQIISLTEDINRLNDKLVKSNFVNGNQLVSSFDNAVVTEVKSKEGDFVNREVSVLTITDLDSRIITADIAEEFIGKIKEGQKVKITTSALQDKEYEGVVSRIWGASVKKGGETIVPIEINIINLDDELLLNFNVDVKIELK